MQSRLQAQGALKKDYWSICGAAVRCAASAITPKKPKPYSRINGQIAMLIAHSHYVMLVNVAGKDAETMVNTLIENTPRLPQELYLS